MIQVLPDKKQECCGCSACSQICPQKCISMIEDREGFSYPEVDIDKCIGCSLCEKACPIIAKKNIDIQNAECEECKEHLPQTIGGWHKNEDIRYESSSGGAFTLFAEYILKQERGVVYGAALNEKMHTEHIGVERMEDLFKLKGSKYVQSDIAGVYKEIKEQLMNDRKVMFVGTPCQCAGLHSFLREDSAINIDAKRYDNLYICDFICHGVPSPKVFRSYINYLEEKYNDKITTFRFRNKDKGWNSTGFQMGTYIGFQSIGNKRFTPAFRDAYMNGFSDNIYLRPSCYSCEFKCLPKYYADITIADFWGVKKVYPELYDGKGTSLVLLHNEHAKELFNRVKDNFFYKEIDFNAAIKKNKSLLKPANENANRNSFFSDYENLPFDKVRKKYLGAFKWVSRRIIKKVQKITS